MNDKLDYKLDFKNYNIKEYWSKRAKIGKNIYDKVIKKFFIDWKFRKLKTNFNGKLHAPYDLEVKGNGEMIINGRVFFDRFSQIICYGRIVLKGENNFDHNLTLRSVSKDSLISIEKESYTNLNCAIISRDKIVIGDFVAIGPYVLIIDFDHKIKDHRLPNFKQGILSAPIIIEDNVWIGGHSVILKGVKIGEGAIIGANSVVTKDVPPYSLAVGSPARVIKYFYEKNQKNNKKPRSELKKKV